MNMNYKMDNNGKPYAVDLNELLESKFEDSSYAVEYLKEVLEDGDLELYFAALGDIRELIEKLTDAPALL